MATGTIGLAALAGARDTKVLALTAVGDLGRLFHFANQPANLLRAAFALAAMAVQAIAMGRQNRQDQEGGKRCKKDWDRFHILRLSGTNRIEKPFPGEFHPAKDC